MTKTFKFHFEEYDAEVAGDDFDDMEYPHHQICNTTVEFSSDTRWTNVMLSFARFLDGIGYVGVFERTEKGLSAALPTYDDMFDDYAAREAGEEEEDESIKAGLNEEE